MVDFHRMILKRYWERNKSLTYGDCEVDMSIGQFCKQRDPGSLDFGHKRARHSSRMNGRNTVKSPDFHTEKVAGDDGLLRVTPDSSDIAALLNLIKFHGKQKNLQEVTRIHDNILKEGLLKTDIFLCTALLHTYADCGALLKAQEVFDELPSRDVVSWTALIGGYAQHGFGEEALYCFEQMQDEGLLPNSVTFMCVLKACGNIGAAEKGREIDAEVRRQGLLEKCAELGNALVDMYAKCGALAKAQKVFHELPLRNVVSWNSLITGYAQHGCPTEALKCFQQMYGEGLSPTAITYTCILKACADVGASEKGEEIHAEIRTQGLLENNIVLGNALVDMYAKCGALGKAEDVLNKLPQRNEASWNALITGYAQHGLGNEALQCYGRMQSEGFLPDIITFVCILKACGIVHATQRGEEIHEELRKQGLLWKNIVLGNAIIDMYVKWGAFTQARKVFDELPVRNAVSWNSLIAGYAQNGLGEKALDCYKQMVNAGFSADVVTFVCVLKACGSTGASEKGEEIHAEVCRQGLLHKSSELGNALVDMYAKCDRLEKAEEVFDELPVRGIVSWNALITGYVQHGLDDEVLSYFEQMQNEDILPDAVTFFCILKTCGSLGALGMGTDIHVEVRRQGFLENNILLGNALVDMYAKCGAIAYAQVVFDELPMQDVMSWTALTAGYTQLGKVHKVLDSLNIMIGDRIEPNRISFIVLLTACSHAGLVKDGQVYFDTMSTSFCIVPGLEHLTCMVDLFSRAGNFEKTLNIIRKVPASDCLPLWSAVLGACQRWMDLELGKFAFALAEQLDNKFPAVHVCISNIYAAASMHEKVDKVETVDMKARS